MAEVNEELLKFMRGLKLDKFLGALHEQGVNHIEDLKFVDREIMDACGFSVAHRKKFEEGWNKRDAAKREFLERSKSRHECCSGTIGKSQPESSVLV
eukprot:6189163-Pyramimonas_sp.AAC.4